MAKLAALVLVCNLQADTKTFKPVWNTEDGYPPEVDEKTGKPKTEAEKYQLRLGSTADADAPASAADEAPILKSEIEVPEWVVDKYRKVSVTFVHWERTGRIAVRRAA